MLDQRQIRSHIKALNAEDQNGRWDAIRSLKQNESPGWESLPAEAVTPLVEALRHQLSKRNAVNGQGKLPVFRQEVIGILGSIGPRAEAAVPQLVELLEAEETHAVREAAATALGKIGKEARVAVDKLIAALAAGRPTLVARVVRALGEIGCADKRVRAALTNLWLAPNQSESCREQVAIALCKLNLDAPGLLPTLTKTLVSHSHTGPKKAAAEALASCDKSGIGVVPALVAALYDADEAVRKIAETGLERMRLTQAKAVELSALQLEECPQAEAALRKAGALAVPALMTALASSKPLVREMAAKVLGSVGETAQPAAAALTKALNDVTPEVRLSAAKALWNVTKQADAAVPALLGLLKEKSRARADDPEARRQFVQSVIEALGRIGPPAAAAAGALNAKSRDENRLIRDSAERALRLINPNAAAKTVFS